MGKAHLDDIVAPVGQAAGSASLDEITGPALKPRTLRETRKVLVERYGKILKGNTDTSKRHIATEVGKGMVKQLGRDVYETGRFASNLANQDYWAGDNAPSELTKKVRGATELEGEAQEYGGIATTAITTVPAGVGLFKFAMQTVARLAAQPGGLIKLGQIIRHPIRYPLQQALLKALEQLLPEEAANIAKTLPKKPGLRPPKFGGAYEPEINAAPGTRLPRGKYTPPVEKPFEVNPKTAAKAKYGGPAEEFDGGARRLTPRKPAQVAEEPVEKFEPFKVNPKTAARARYGGPAEEFDEGARRLPVKRKLEPKPPKDKPKAKDGKTTKTTQTPTAGKQGSGFDTGSEPTATSIKHEAKHTDVMRAVFANARNLGVDSKALREAAKEFYGKGISEMSYDEVVDLNERLLMNKAVPK